MKTVLTQMIEKWESEMGSYIPNVGIYRAFIEDAKTFLEAERLQIIDAYEASATGLGEEYFEKTFERVILTNYKEIGCTGTNGITDYGYDDINNG